MNKLDKPVLEGKIIKSLGGSQFKVHLETGQNVKLKLKGSFKKKRIKIVKGDKVKVKLSPYDMSKGYIVKRLDKNNKDNKNN